MPIQQLFAARLASPHLANHTVDCDLVETLPDHLAGLRLLQHVGRHRRRHDRRSLSHHRQDADVEGLYVNCGWGTGGFKATPGSGNVFAWTIAKDEPHRINAPFTIERFRDGILIDEAAAAAVAH